MESVNETFEKILYFLSILQNACDSKRLLIEQHNIKCYALYAKEWKSEQKRKEKEVEFQKQITLNTKEHKKEADLFEGKDLEEISKADSLLEKARAIRNKKMLTKNSSKLEPIPLLESLADVGKPSKNSQKDMFKSLKNNYSTMLPHYKSNQCSKSLKTTKLTSSKSSSDCSLKKEISVPNKSNSSLRKAKTMQTSLGCKDIHFKESENAFVSDKLFNELKCLSVAQKIAGNQHLKENNAENHSVMLNSDAPQNATYHNVLSRNSFRNDLKSTLNLKSHFQLQNDGLWYPIISLNNKKFLFKWSKCNTFENFSKVSKLIYKIQETMLWIDVLSLLEKDILPSIKILDKNDKNVIRMCSYLSSLYHESLQRIPMLCPD